MSQPQPNNEPQLDTPGAGLPRIELMVARLIFGWHWRRTSREAASAAFTSERAAILKLVSECGDVQASRRILIPRLRGLEDSSRYWSVFMTLDHLHIVNHAVATGIQLLGQGKVPPKVASTADVKPSPTVDASVVAGFEAACDDFEQSAAQITDLHTKATYAHPWFGPLDAAGWHVLGGFHMRLHRKQIERILSDLPGSA